MHKFQMYMKRGHLGRKALPIMVNNELKALWSNKQIIYSSLLSPFCISYFIRSGFNRRLGIFLSMERPSVFFLIP